MAGLPALLAGRTLRSRPGRVSFEGWIVPAWGRRPQGRDPGAESASEAAASSVASSEAEGETTLGGSLVAIRREREIHAMLLAELDRRGDEATADELYDEIAARWDLAHQAAGPTAVAAVAAPAEGPAPQTAQASDIGPRPGWAAELLEEQRATNRLLLRLVELVESREGRIEP